MAWYAVSYIAKHKSPQLKKESSMIEIESLDSEGRGVARVDGKVLFIGNALPAERVKYRILKDKKTYALAQAEKIDAPSPLRIDPKCRYFGVCGGCATQHIQPTAQVAFKQRILEDALTHIGSVRKQIMLSPIYGQTWHYRFRARMSVKYVVKKDAVLVGFHERKSPFIVDMESCQIMPKHVSDLIVPLRQMIARLSIRQRLPQIEWAIGEKLTVLALRVMDEPNDQDKIILRQFIDEYQSDEYPLQMWLQPGNDTTLHPFYPLEIPHKLTYSLPQFAIEMPFHPSEFTQVNPAVNRLMIARAMQLLQPKAGERIVDLFCGIGNFTLPIARLGAQVLGVEGSKKLLERAHENACLNGLSERVSFQVANLFKEKEIEIKQWSDYDKWLIDPPRDGAQTLVQMLEKGRGPRTIVYVSCKPSTLARDAQILQEKGYCLRQAGVMNMFPNTTHVESIALFEQNNLQHR